MKIACRNLLQTQKCPGRTVFSTFFCNGWKMFSMSFEIAPENAPCMHWCCQVVPQASRRVVWGVLSKMTILKGFCNKKSFPFPPQPALLGDFIPNTSITECHGPKFGGFFVLFGILSKYSVHYICHNT